MMALPTHKAMRISDCGVFLKKINPLSAQTGAVEYAHRDEYYLFGLIHGGMCSVSIDFREYQLSKGELMCVQPRQVHSSLRSTDLEASLLLVDSLFMGDLHRHILDEYALNPSPIPMTARQQSELDLLFTMLSDRIGTVENDVSKEIVRNISCSAIGVIVEAIQNIRHAQPGNKRYVDITLKFRSLLHRELHQNRSPSHYAASLNLSAVYLNEVINAVTGLSVSKYIRNEIVLRAKRQLFYTKKSVREIADELGFDDAAYFTKLFSQTAGFSPTLFRKRYLE